MSFDWLLCSLWGLSFHSWVILSPPLHISEAQPAHSLWLPPRDFGGAFGAWETAALLITNKTEFLRVRYGSDVIFPHHLIFQEFSLHHIWPLLRGAGPRGLGLTAGPFHRRPRVALRVVCGPFLSALSPGPAFGNYRNYVSCYRNTVVQLVYAFP